MNPTITLDLVVHCGARGRWQRAKRKGPESSLFEQTPPRGCCNSVTCSTGSSTLQDGATNVCMQTLLQKVWLSLLLEVRDLDCVRHLQIMQNHVASLSFLGIPEESQTLSTISRKDEARRTRYLTGRRRPGRPCFCPLLQPRDRPHSAARRCLPIRE